MKFQIEKMKSEILEKKKKIRFNIQSNLIVTCKYVQKKNTHTQEVTKTERDFKKSAIIITDRRLAAKFINRFSLYEVHASVEVGSLLTAEVEPLGAPATDEASTGDDDELPTAAVDGPLAEF